MRYCRETSSMRYVVYILYISMTDDPMFGASHGSDVEIRGTQLILMLIGVDCSIHTTVANNWRWYGSNENLHSQARHHPVL